MHKSSPCRGRWRARITAWRGSWDMWIRQLVTSRLLLRRFYCSDRPVAIIAFDRNSEAVEFIEPKPVHRSRLAVSQNHGFANKLGLSPFEFDKDRAGSRISGWHGGRWLTEVWLKASARDACATLAAAHAPALHSNRNQMRLSARDPVFDLNHACHIISPGHD